MHAVAHTRPSGLVSQERKEREWLAELPNTAPLPAEAYAGLVGATPMSQKPAGGGGMGKMYVVITTRCAYARQLDLACVNHPGLPVVP